LYAFLMSFVCPICSTSHILFDFITLMIVVFGEAYKLRSSSLCSLIHSPTTSSLLGPNILLSNLFSNTLNLCFLLSVRDQVSHPYKTSKITVVYVLIVKF